jgi:hypothetical protein
MFQIKAVDINEIYSSCHVLISCKVAALGL